LKSGLADIQKYGTARTRKKKITEEDIAPCFSRPLMQKVVFDTNIYISAFITLGGQGEAAYQKAIEGRIQLYSSIRF